MKNLADFPSEEYKNRCEKARRLMDEYNIDALLLTEEENVTYLSGFRKMLPNFSKARGYMLHFILLPRDGAPVLLLPLPMRGNAELSSWIEDKRFFVAGITGLPPIDPLKLTIGTIEELGLVDRVIGLELGDLTRIDSSQKDFEAIRNGLPHAKFVDSSELIWKMRSIKSPLEIQYMRKVCGITCKAFQAGFESIEEGMTEKELARIIYKAMLDEGSEDTPLMAALLIRSGPNRYRLSDTRPSDTKMKKGHIIVVDGGTHYKGYFSDMTRLACIGEPTKKQKEMFECALKAEEAGVQAIRSGATAGDVFTAADNVITELGFNKNFIYRFCGHGIGLRVHEPPSIAQGSETVLQPGMVLCVEPVLYDKVSLTYMLNGIMGKGAEGVFYLEDEVVVTERGHENLTPMEKTLWIV